MSSSRDSIAILGATGHVGKCLIDTFLSVGGREITAVVRDTVRFKQFLDSLPNGARCQVASFDEFPRVGYGAIVNCVGIGTPSGVTVCGSGIFDLTERFDGVVMDYLEAHPDTQCVSFSSGAAYCGDFAEPATENTSAVVPLNHVTPKDYYGLAKLASEARHRAAADLAIVDLRLFGLFSRHIDVSTNFLMCDVLRATMDKAPLQVGPEDIVRDYIAPQDMAAFVAAVIDSGPRNQVFDLYSAAPVAKFEVLDHFSERYGLEYEIVGAASPQGATGLKPNYYSLNRRAETIGYSPSRTSIETLCDETEALLARG
ncbi:MAG: NAD(P)-dependent oxidoreductase [Actinobacteria bacterium]|nr:NAD(P)-dependent oxidoreductase [Actinomycetota bacterium]